jgi:hypothetical protein
MESTTQREHWSGAGDRSAGSGMARSTLHKRNRIVRRRAEAGLFWTLNDPLSVWSRSS